MKRTRKVLSLKQSVSTARATIFNAVCLDLAEDLKADLVSIWFFDEAHTAIHCQLAYDAIANTSESGQVIYRKDCPHYFQTIVEDSCIVAFDAQNQNTTRELAKIYLIPNGVLSTLDFILHKGRIPIGLISCECREIPRDWSEADKNKLRAIAELVSHRLNFNLEDSA